MNYIFPIHLDGGNRGCEGIAKGTAEILKLNSSNSFGWCTNIKLDQRLGISKYYTLIPGNKALPFCKRVERKIQKMFLSSLKEKIQLDAKYQYRDLFKKLGKDDLMLSTGGDMMCYGNNQVISTNNYLHSKGYKTVLWGCSMGKENLTPEKEETLRNFTLIYARESLSFDFFKSLGLKNVVCFPDPAFVLTPQVVDLPKIFKEDKGVIGINLSNFVLGAFDLNTSFGKQVRELIKYIIDKTEFNILLIPHVLWDAQDDRIVANNVYKLFQDTGRISVLDSDIYNYLQLRYIISKCRLFIGARTHAVISAYSTCVPSLALGYSIKSKGIAKDLGLDNNLVVNCKDNESNNSLLKGFRYLVDNEDAIKKQLTDVMPSYIKEAYKIRNIINKL